MILKVNYIWIQRGSSNTPRIPERAFAAFQQNARRYGDISFQLWVENTDVFDGYVLPPNVTVRFRDELNPEENQELEDLPIFETKVDLLRLFVLRKTLTENDDIIAVYSDFDITDLHLNSTELIDRINKFGMAFAGSYHPEYIVNIRNYLGLFKMSNTVAFGKFKKTPLNHASPLCLRTYCEHGKILLSHFENGFLSFACVASPILDNMIQCVRDDLTNRNFSEDERDTVYYSMARTLDSWARKNSEIPVNWTSEVAGFYVQHCAGWRLDDISTLIPERKFLFPKEFLCFFKSFCDTNLLKKRFSYNCTCVRHWGQGRRMVFWSHSGHQL